ncbi:26S proteasome non-ATPase regulatory subunit 10 (26S proteasome regulatory subunit p28) (Gankyrin) [Durusdinium trenchii]|uniref:26S proteasome non-ATPase regulatory subunit 10 (26S proteasome regulatory subunit p28) (Gankyrin) n=1 Tax=Durusdinium trenchii TaxID=1381693 RepID=A0ABP0RCC2_9DINO
MNIRSKKAANACADPNAPADSGAFGVGFTQVGAFPLHLAAKRGRLEVMEVLLRSGASLDVADQNGRTALMVAAASGQSAASGWLLAKKAAVDCQTHYGYTALHYAALVPRPEVVRILLDAKARTGSIDREGRTALHAALSTLPSGGRSPTVVTSCDPAGIGDEYCYDHDISHGYRRLEQEEMQLRVVKMAVSALLSVRADVELRDGTGRNALDIVKGKRRWELLQWLTEEGQPARTAWSFQLARAPGRAGALLLGLLQRQKVACGVGGDDLNFEPVQVTSHCHKGQWCPLPENFLSASEACEFAVLRVNEMRQKCHGFTLAPIRRQDYKVAGTVRKDMDGYSVYKLLLEPINKFVPTSVEIEVAHLHRITDLSIFQAV